MSITPGHTSIDRNISSIFCVKYIQQLDILLSPHKAHKNSVAKKKMEDNREKKERED